MARFAIIFGALLTILGIVLYSRSDLEGPQKLTALIPSAFGLALVLLGQVANGASEKTRMHVMHAAVLVGLIGLIGGVVMTVLDINKHNMEPPPEKLPSTLATGGKATMALLCGVFVGLCVKSFIDVRAARKRNQAHNPPPGPTGPTGS